MHLSERAVKVTNVYATPEKLPMKDFLFHAAERALAAEGWKVERIARSGKPSVRRITKGGVEKSVSIRTSQDTWIAFPRTKDGAAWATLDGVDFVVAASIDNYENPRFANIHLVPGDDIRERFDRAYAARKAAGHVIPNGRGVWLSLYDKESADPVTLVGGGIGLAHPPIATVPLNQQQSASLGAHVESEPAHEPASQSTLTGEEQSSQPSPANASSARALRIAEAKRGLALTFGVNEEAIEITIRG